MIQIVFENEHVVVCDKPSGVLSVPDRLGKDSKRKCLGLELQKKLQRQIFPAHRLDFEVSGLIIYAKTARAHEITQNWFQKKQIQKYYLAQTLKQDFTFAESWPDKAKQSLVREPILVSENSSLSAPPASVPASPPVSLPTPWWEWTSRIVKGKRRVFEAPHGDLAITRARILKILKSTDSFSHYSQVKESYFELNSSLLYLWELEPVTGRSHQLRFELCKHGFPIVGDTLYGGLASPNEDWIALRAYKIEFKTNLPDTSEINRLGLPPVLTLNF